MTHRSLELDHCVGVTRVIWELSLGEHHPVRPVTPPLRALGNETAKATRENLVTCEKV